MFLGTSSISRTLSMRPVPLVLASCAVWRIAPAVVRRSASCCCTPGKSALVASGDRRLVLVTKVVGDTLLPRRRLAHPAQLIAGKPISSSRHLIAHRLQERPAAARVGHGGVVG